MSLFSNIHTKRRTAHMVLLVWLFAMACGWANACPLTVQRTHVSLADAGLDADHAENANLGKAACLKVCDDGSQSITQQASTLDLMDVTMAPPLAQVWQAQLATAVRGNAWRAVPAPSPGLPLRTRFARLAL